MDRSKFSVLIFVLLLRVHVTVAVYKLPPDAKRHYVVAALANQGNAVFYNRFYPTFVTYLNETVGPMFDPPVTFDAIPVSFDAFLETAASLPADFTYTHPSLFSCVASEFGFTAVATLRSYRRGLESNLFGGVVVVKANRNDINTLSDIRNKIVSSVSISSHGGHQMQALEALYAGVHMMTDVRQLIFTGTPQDALRFMLRGDSEVAFLRTDVLESLVDAGELNMSDVKIINEQFPTIEGGKPFPFKISTRIYPEWAFAVNALTVDLQVQKHVILALYTLNSTNEYSVRGVYASWQPALSYLEPRSMLERLELIQQKEAGRWSCVRTSEVYNGIICPANYYRPSKNDVMNSCSSAGLKCPEDARDCLCRPCLPACEKNAHLTENGCVCNCNFVEFSGQCVPVASIFGMIFGPIVFLILVVALLYVRYQAKKADKAWQTNPADLHIPDTPAVLGMGTFGVVLQAEYHGTQVAVKRGVPFKANTDATGRSMLGLFRRSFKNEDLVRINRVFDDCFNRSEGNIANKSTIEMTINLRKKQQSTHLTKNAATSTKSTSWLSKIWDRSAMLQRRSFFKEMRLLQKLRHPNVCTIMGAIVDKQAAAFLILELMNMGSLYEVLHNETLDMDGEVKLGLLNGIASALRFLHAYGIVHGDMKSSNCLVDEKWHVKVADFGTASKKPTTASGTLCWMAPECLLGACTSPASDVYSFGIVVFELLSRQDPYDIEAFSIPQLVQQISVGKLRPSFDIERPAELIKLAKQSWDKNPELRPDMASIDSQISEMTPAIFPQTKAYKHNGYNSGDDVLEQVFPKHVAEALKHGKKVEPEHFEITTIFFSDIVGFTDISGALSPEKVMNMLDRLYTRLDTLVDKYELFKVETIGDAFMCVSNISKPQPDDHVKRIAEFSIEALSAANATLIDEENTSLGCINLRIGFHSGPVVANVIGTKNPRYCLFGDTVNTASRMESNSEKNRVHMSDSSMELLRLQAPGMKLEERGLIPIKGKGMMNTAFLATSNPTISHVKDDPVPQLDAFRQAEASKVISERAIIDVSVV